MMEQYEKDKEIERLNKDVSRLEELLSVSETQYASVEQIVERLQEQLDELQNDNNNLCNDIVDLNLTIENKEKQLNDANKVIKKYSDGTIYLFPTWYNGSRLAEAYLKKWGVK